MQKDEKFSGWYEVAAVCRKEEKEVKDVGGQEVFIRGELEDLLIIQVPKGTDHGPLLQGVQEMIRREKIDKGVIVLDQDIDIMKFVPVERKKAKMLEHQHQSFLAQQEKKTQSLH